VWAGTPISIALLILNFNSGFALFYGGEFGWWVTQNLGTVFHIALVFLIMMRILPSQVKQESKLALTIARPIIAVSDRTYHILLIQTAYFFVVFAHVAVADSILLPQTNAVLWLMSKILLAIVEFSICASMAFGLYWLDSTLLKMIRRIKNTRHKEGMKAGPEKSESTSIAGPTLHGTGPTEAG
jgi:hypothetical protein